LHDAVEACRPSGGGRLGVCRLASCSGSAAAARSGPLLDDLDAAAAVGAGMPRLLADDGGGQLAGAAAVPEPGLRDPRHILLVGKDAHRGLSHALGGLDSMLVVLQAPP